MADNPADLPESSGSAKREDLLEVARQAASERQPDRMLEALVASGFLDGITHRLESEWRGRLPRTEIEESVAVAVDGAYDAVARGRAVHNLGAWIWKAASNLAIDRWNKDYDLRAPIDGDTLLDARQDPQLDSSAGDLLAEYRLKEAIRLARSLLPRIGQGQVVEVMRLVIDAVEQGIQDLPPDAIGDALGLSAQAVRSLLSRGFERLEREARREGITLPDAVPTVIRDDARDEDGSDDF